MAGRPAPAVDHDRGVRAAAGGRDVAEHAAEDDVAAVLARLGAQGLDDRLIERDGDLGGRSRLAGGDRVLGEERQVDGPAIPAARFHRHLIDQPAHLLKPPAESGVIAVPSGHGRPDDHLARRPVVPGRRGPARFRLVGTHPGGGAQRRGDQDPSSNRCDRGACVVLLRRAVAGEAVSDCPSLPPWSAANPGSATPAGRRTGAPAWPAAERPAQPTGAIRAAMGHMQMYADRMNLAEMTPQNHLC